MNEQDWYEYFDREYERVGEHVRDALGFSWDPQRIQYHRAKIWRALLTFEEGRCTQNVRLMGSALFTLGEYAESSWHMLYKKGDLTEASAMREEFSLVRQSMVDALYHTVEKLEDRVYDLEEQLEG